MAVLQAGEKAPDFCLQDQDGNEVCLKAFRGKWVVLYFYPRDNTPGCTLEAIQFTAKHEAFKQMNTVILGISPDSMKSHCNFIEKHDLTLQLLSDESHRVLEAYGAWGEKKMAGKSFLGVIRTTCLINPDGKVQQLWQKVKVKGHAEAVLARLNEIQS